MLVANTVHLHTRPVLPGDHPDSVDTADPLSTHK